MSENFSRRGFLGLAAGGVAAAGLAGCGFAPPSGGGGSSSSGALVFRWWGGEARNRAYQQTLDLFKQKTGITVTAQFSGYDGYFNKLNTEFAGGNPPDIFQMDTALVSTYAAKGVLTDLSRYIPDTIHLDTLYPAVRTAGTVGGKPYGVPSGSGYAPVVYDKNVFEQAKIPVPTDNWTWNDFTTIAGELSKAMGSGKYGALDASRDDSGALQPWLRQRGKDLYTAEGVLGFNEDDLKEWFTYWEGLRKSGAICPPEMLSNADSATGNHPLITGQVAMTTGWGLAQIQPLTQHALDIVIVPRGSNGKTGQAPSGGVLLSVPVKSSNPDGAAKLIDFFATDTDAIKIMGIQRGFPPSDKALNTLLPSLSASDKRDVTYGQYVSQEVVKDGIPNAPTAPAGYNDVKNALDAAAKQVAFAKMSVADGVTRFFSDAKTALANAK
ncbi:multiple sugar transport system substrate-binding protein [Kibdelosporangium banguiense]|uniref:Multiple sugar transport system substrate-binding protein n=1 Tax=Kibdelosporangium banguiense TaxID=1365924 RepID=A0ABS4U2R0_9PSEU|nr:extracellular solute-binding protein [Kibdelosporangium banguiense]MBP2330503.1 multiple sugar transport system substrate-binding protein [Kibdelosporangium banguiense]